MIPRTLRLMISVLLACLAGCGGGQTTLSGNAVQTPTTPVTTATPAGGQYATAQSVVLQTTLGADIYYTTDGSTPSTASTRYTGAIPIAKFSDLKFFAVASQGQEAVKTEHYSLPVPVHVTVSGVSQAMSGLKATLTLPAGVSVGTNGDGSVASGAVSLTGVALSATVLPASLSYDPATRKLSFILYTAAPGGFAAGEFASVACVVSGALPVASAFSAVLEPVDLLGVILAPASASFLVVP